MALERDIRVRKEGSLTQLGLVSYNLHITAWYYHAATSHRPGQADNVPDPQPIAIQSLVDAL